MAENKKKVITISLTKNNDFLVVRVDTFGQLGFSEKSKTGLLKIDPDRDPEEVFGLAQEIKDWKFEGEPDHNGFYRVEPITD